jgi:short-subunit dehydrogenase
MRALVVGASAEVGRTIAAEVAGSGAALVVAARSHEALRF